MSTRLSISVLLRLHTSIMYNFYSRRGSKSSLSSLLSLSKGSGVTVSFLILRNLLAISSIPSFLCQARKDLGPKDGGRPSFYPTI